MRWVLAAIIVLVALPGCLSQADMERMDTLTKRITELDAKARDIKEAVENGSIPLSDGLALVKDVAELKADASNEIDYLKNKGYKWYEIVGGILGSVVTSLTGVRLWRGGIHKRAGESPDA